MNDTSLFPILKASIIQAAKNAIAAGKKEQHVEREKQIAKAMRHGFWRKLFLMAPRTRCEAEIFVDYESSAIESFLTHWKYQGLGKINWGESMLKACNAMNGDTAYLSEDDARILSCWLKWRQYKMEVVFVNIVTYLKWTLLNLVNYAAFVVRQPIIHKTKTESSIVNHTLLHKS